jgi:hypothetical protein
MRFLKNRGKSVVAATMAAALAGLMTASMAFAAPHHPTGEFVNFGDCPLNNPSVTQCVYSLTNGGGFTIGNKEVPLKNPVTLQGGLDTNVEPPQFYGAEDGNTLSKTAQPVPGGLLGITAPSWWPQFLKDYFNEVVINGGATGVTATVELAAPATSVLLRPENLLFEEGTALQLPIKIHLQNAFLGSNCYIGSNSHPVVIPFTTGATSPPPPNTSIHGAAGKFEFNPGFTLVTISGGRLVENAFSAPGASGCGGLFSFLVDPLVNSILGTPAAAGRNTAILEGKLQEANGEAVRASE